MPNAYFNGMQIFMWTDHCHTLRPSLCMTKDNQLLGRCPECGAEIPPAWTLVEYEKEDGTEGIWAECPDCETVVDPEGS